MFLFYLCDLLLSYADRLGDQHPILVCHKGFDRRNGEQLLVRQHPVPPLNDRQSQILHLSPPGATLVPVRLGFRA